MEPDPGSAPEVIPTYRIDLSLPPSERYVQVAKDFAPRMQSITPLFDKVLASVIPWPWLRSVVQTLALVFLRRVYSNEETEELRGISLASGVQMYFLVALNVLLDSLLGCTSGGAMVRSAKSGRKNPSGSGWEERKMMHFRTLDWGMDELRSVLVVLEFVESKSKDPGKVIARSISYAGFVGVLTGVRPTHSCSTRSLRWHQILVLFGIRPSVTHSLRSVLLQPPAMSSAYLLESSLSTLATQRCAPCYLILCDGRSTGVIEKDLFSSKIRTSRSFIVHTNHDTKSPDREGAHIQKDKSTILGMESTLEESEERMDCIQSKWDRLESRYKYDEEGDMQGGAGPSIREETLKGWVRAFPIMNECTHFGCIMDPRSGTIRWLERGIEEEGS